MVAAAGTLQVPTVALQQLDQLATLHRVYYTHRSIFKPMTALRLSNQSSGCLKLGRSVTFSNHPIGLPTLRLAGSAEGR